MKTMFKKQTVSENPIKESQKEGKKKVFGSHFLSRQDARRALIKDSLERTEGTKVNESPMKLGKR